MKTWGIRTTNVDVLVREEEEENNRLRLAAQAKENASSNGSENNS